MFDYPVWTWVCIGVGIMTGILSLIRDIRQAYRPTEQKTTKRVLWAFIRVAFLVSAILVWYAEHQKVINLTDQLYSKRIQLYNEFVEEKTRRISLYDRGASLQVGIELTQAELNMPRLQKNTVYPYLQRDLDSYARDHRQWIKDRDEENAKFSKLIMELKRHFKDSKEFQAVEQTIATIPGFDLKEPDKNDIKNDESFKNWIKQNETNKHKYVREEVRAPLDKLSEYLQQNLK